MRDTADDVFSLNYNSSLSLNPYATHGQQEPAGDASCVCDNVFELDDDYQPLFPHRHQLDGVRRGHLVDAAPSTPASPMHDGSTLTAADVAYSIQLARNSERYSGRFSNVYGVSPSGDGHW